MLKQTKAGRGQDEPLADPFEQHDAEPGLQRGDLAGERRLRQPEPSRGRGQRAGVRRGAERARQVPVDVVHAISYMLRALSRNLQQSRM